MIIYTLNEKKNQNESIDLIKNKNNHNNMEEQPNEIEVGFEMNKVFIVCLCLREIVISQ